MAIVYGKHTPKFEWRQNGYKMWEFVVSLPVTHFDDTLRVGYSSITDTWIIFINAREVGQAHTLKEAQDLAILLYKLHPEWREETNK
jgi:hypothetical protein